MPRFILTTRIKAPAAHCFDLARSIDLHLETMQHSEEKAIAGVTSGLIGLGETVTWEARHFGIKMKLISKITICEFPVLFCDEMLEGPFKSLIHRHFFAERGAFTLMIDEFAYESPLGILGCLADLVFLEKYMRKLILHRNAVIKQKAELPT
ncbi:SRPBCC family protein [Pedobacter sp. SYSU D00535]|uniref:SRPBCC family protein n=1 Tax=Pedobacter sp. SYSU D00535 TaxID=2810308 RepID=UPI001A962729|nr:SRPBCC family protein [Pedobacter sp. SYSU D00535]